MKKTDTFADRRKEAEAAKNRRLEKFKVGSDKNSPEAAARASARQAESTARAERKAAAELEKKDKAEKIKLEADAAAAASCVAADAEVKRAAEAAEAQSILDEASRKTKRDARYANRKARS